MRGTYHPALYEREEQLSNEARVSAEPFGQGGRAESGDTFLFGKRETQHYLYGSRESGVDHLSKRRTCVNDASYTALDVKDLMVDSSENFQINSSGGYLGGSPSKILGAFALSE